MSVRVKAGTSHHLQPKLGHLTTYNNFILFYFFFFFFSVCDNWDVSPPTDIFFFFLNTTYQHKGEENERKIAENFQKQATLNSEPKPSWLNHLTTYGDYFFFSIFFSVRLTDSNMRKTKVIQADTTKIW